MRKFASGFVTGTLAAAAVVASVVMGVKRRLSIQSRKKNQKLMKIVKKLVEKELLDKKESQVGFLFYL